MDANEELTESLRNESPERIQYDYIKSQYFRTVHAEGIWGGITPRLGIHMDFWSERPSIPKHVAHEITSAGLIGKEILSETINRSTIIREVEVGVTVDLGTAKQIIEWLQQRVDIIESALSQQQDINKSGD
jgi:hypothetical protein